MSAINQPYFSCIREDCKETETGEKYEGFVVDLVENIFEYFKKEKIDYKYVFVDDILKPQGKYDLKEKKWNGMIGELLDKVRNAHFIFAYYLIKSNKILLKSTITK